MSIVPFLKYAVFEPQDIKELAIALDEVCKELRIDGDQSAREVVAMRLLGLAMRGERSAVRLRDRLLEEANDKLVWRASPPCAPSSASGEQP
jgi:hypothetical protein